MVYIFSSLMFIPPWIRIRINIMDPDPYGHFWFPGFGSETLLQTRDTATAT